jgi:isocitrate/isopropylmalate dehydrogenase
VLLPGDGIGPEIAAAAVELLRVTELERIASGFHLFKTLRFGHKLEFAVYRSNL